MEFSDLEGRLQDLSPKEHEIAGFISQGRDNLTIAQKLGIEENTVRRYVSLLYKKVFGEEGDPSAKRARRVYLGQLYKQYCAKQAEGTGALPRYSISDEANIAFLQALGTTLARWNEVPPEERDREAFIGLFDAFLDMVIQAANNSGDDVRDEVQRLRALLEVAMSQVLETA